MSKKQLDTLCKYYAEGIALCVHNAETLEEYIARKRAEGKDPAQEEKAVRRLMASKEGLQRMLSDRALALKGGAQDPAKVLEDLAAMKTRARDKGEEDALSNALALIVRQREKLTNTDRGRRALQKKLGKEKRQVLLLGKEAAALRQNNTDLRKVVGPMISDRERLLREHAKHHCLDGMCAGCPFENACWSPDASQEARNAMQERMHQLLCSGDGTNNKEE